jgi:hypothetical protein
MALGQDIALGAIVNVRVHAGRHDRAVAEQRLNEAKVNSLL